MGTKFKSQICTNIEQSRRLLTLGLKMETADCVHRLLNRWDGYCVEENDWSERIYSIEHIPAWSLHRLIEMMPNCIPNQGWLSIGHQGLHYSKGYGVADDGLYGSIIDCIEWLIKEGYFPKEYLV